MEELLEQESGAEPEQALDTSSVAVALALNPPAGAPPAVERFLARQGELVAKQLHHLDEQLRMLRLDRWSKRLRLALQALTILVGVLALAAVLVMAWKAHEDHGVVIEAFSVPPDLAARGMTGQVAAREVLDRLSDMQAQTVTVRPASTYADAWSNDIKVEIPETGVSVGELDRYLHRWLGRQTVISGEIVRSPAGLEVTARAGDATGRRFDGPDADIHRLIGMAAESIYSETQPYRYATYLASHGKQAEALAAYERLVRSGAPEDRAWAYAGWSSVLLGQFKVRAATEMAEAALRIDPKLFAAHQVLGQAYDNLGRAEAAHSLILKQIEIEQRGGYTGERNRDRSARLLRGLLASETGDFQTAVSLIGTGRKGYFEAQGGSFDSTPILAQILAADHDVTQSRALSSGGAGLNFGQTTQLMELEDWTAAAASMPPPQVLDGLGDLRLTVAWPGIAAIDAHLGRFAQAEALLAQTPLDCYRCLQARGLVASLKGDWAAVDRWYAEAARQGPSLPFAHTGWGYALLRKGDLDAAVGKLNEAHRRSPHFADPLELWGEALTAKHDYAGAVAKFAEADKYAPHWGRNHMRWGEALMLSGRLHEARAQYETANRLDLSKPDRAALNVLLARTASGPLHG
jgi:tetratricopeptide (TPR) repeat protein